MAGRNSLLNHEGLIGTECVNLQTTLLKHKWSRQDTELVFQTFLNIRMRLT